LSLLVICDKILSDPVRVFDNFVTLGGTDLLKENNRNLGGVAERLPSPERARRPEERSDEGLKAAEAALLE